MANIIGGSIGAGKAILNDYTLGVEDIDGGHRLTITRGSEVQTLDVMDGKNGIDGKDGAPGADGRDGIDGKDGAPGAVQTVNGEAPDESGNVQVSGLPEGAGANMQLVTDAEGTAKWEDRLAYEEIEYKTLLEEQMVTTDGVDGEYSALLFELLGLESGKTYTVNFDGTEYHCVGTELSDSVGIGNKAILGGGDDTGEPFMIMSYSKGTILFTTSDGTHTISISGPAIQVHKIHPKYTDISIGSNTITIEMLNELKKSKSSIFYWGNKVFRIDSIGIQDLNGYVNLSTIDGIDSRFDIVDGAISFENISRSYYKVNNLKDKNASHPSLNIKSDLDYIMVEPYAVSSGNGTSKKRFVVMPDGLENSKRFSVLGNGTVEAYALILPSTTPGSTKNFKITIDDSGTISATEVTV